MPGFIASKISLERMERNSLPTQRKFEEAGYQLVGSNFFRGSPTYQPLEVYRDRLREEIISGGYYGIRAFSMAVLLVRSLAPDLEDFEGPIVLIEGPNTASRKLLFWWALSLKRMPLGTRAERDIYCKSAFSRRISDSNGLGKVPPLEIHGRWSSDFLTRSAFKPLSYALQANFPRIGHTDLRISQEVNNVVIRYLDDPIGFIV